MPKDATPRKRMVVEEVPTTTPVESIETPVEPVESVTETPTGVTEETTEPAEKPTEEVVVEAKTEEPKVEEKTIPKVEDYIPYGSDDKGFNPMTVIIPGVLLLGALIGGVLFYQSKNSQNPSATPESTTEVTSPPSSLPTASPAATLDLTKYKIAVLNGGGTPGEAGKAKTLLETAGFTVSSTANAKDYSFTKTIIGAKTSVDKAFLDALSMALAKTYVVGTIEPIASSSADSVVVTIGSSKE